MPDQAPAAWETNAAPPFLTIEGAPVGVWALGGDRFVAKTPEFEQLVVGHTRRAGRRTSSVSSCSR
jgi:hypothetical protein